MGTSEWIISGLLAIVAYFLKDTINKQDLVIVESAKNKNDILLLEQATQASMLLHKQESNSKHTRLEEKLDELKEVIKEMTEELKTYNNKN